MHLERMHTIRCRITWDNWGMGGKKCIRGACRWAVRGGTISIRSKCTGEDQ